MKPLAGVVSVPGDKSISHRSVLFSLLTDGTCRVSGWLDSQDTRSSLNAVIALGGKAEFRGGDLQVTPPVGPPTHPKMITLDCGNSGTTVRLLMGLLAGWLDSDGAAVRLVGDASLSTRPMARVVDPLRAMGANITYDMTEGRLPLVVRGAPLKGCHHRLQVPSAQVKTALQLAGLFAVGETTIGGAEGARDHTDRLLAIMGQELKPFQITVPADPSTAAFFQVAAALIPGSRITTDNLCLNPGRAGALVVLDRAGAEVIAEQTVFHPAEPMGKVTVGHKNLKPFEITASEVPGLIDELPVLAVLATQAAGSTVITGAADLRVKESDRISAMAVALKMLGADITEHRDGWTIVGPTALCGGTPEDPKIIRTFGDHRVAMSLAVAALISKGHIALDDAACVSVSFPDFFLTLNELVRIN